MSDFIYTVLPAKKKAENPALLFLLHGYGSDEKDLFSFAELINENYLVISLRAPRRLPWGGYAWYDIDFSNSAGRFGNPEQALESLQKVNDFIDEMLVKYNADRTKTALLGFSQGAILSYALSFQYPQKFKNVLALSGYVFKEIMPSNQQSSSSVYFHSHGLQDEVIPIAWARNADSYLSESGVNHEYHEYEMGHGINQDCFNDMLRWLNQNN